MKLSATRLQQLKQLLQEQLGPKYKDEDIQQAAAAILSFVLHKELRKRAHDKEDNDERKR